MEAEVMDPEAMEPGTMEAEVMGAEAMEPGAAEAGAGREEGAGRTGPGISCWRWERPW